MPNGRKLGDPHLDYKLAWLMALRDTAAGWLADDPSGQIALTGDWNVAPLDEDVFDMAQFAKSTHVSPPERAAFQAVIDREELARTGASDHAPVIVDLAD